MIITINKKTFIDSFILMLLSPLILLTSSAIAQDEVSVEHLAGDVYMISGGGGANISVLSGEGKALVVDSKFPPSHDQIVAIIEDLSGGKVEYLINSHEHPDHTDGNEAFGNEGAIIIAHESVHTILTNGQRGGPPAPEAARPKLTIPDNGNMTLYFEDEIVNISHAPPAHTPANSMIFFEQANVLHLGDLYGPERYPVIAGGHIDGFIAASETALAIANEQTVIVPGVGSKASRSQLQSFHNMLVSVKERVADLIAQGNSLEEVMAQRPTQEFDATWGSPDRFLTGLYQNLADE